MSHNWLEKLAHSARRTRVVLAASLALFAAACSGIPGADFFGSSPPPPPAQIKTHPKAPYLRLVVDRQSPALLNFGSGDLLQQMVQVFHRWNVANRQDDSRIV